MKLPAGDQAATAELLQLARIDFAVFCTAMKRGFETPPHILYLIEKLERVARGQLRRLIVSLPPRHGKSLLASILFVAWRLGLDPRMQIIFATYSAEFAEDFGRAVRNMLSDPLYHAIFPQCRLAEDSAAAHRFNTTAGGSYVATGVGGAITGRGADLLLIDDPIKGYEEAHSATARKALHEWFAAVAFTRLQPNGATVLIQTAWHLDDLRSRILREHMDEGWESVSLPALAEEGDPLGRVPGEALWPERYPVQVLQSIRAHSGSAVWTALYQQNPVAAEGQIFRREWWRYYTDLPESFVRIVMSADTAFKTGTQTDYSVITIWGETKTGLYLLHVLRKRLEFPELKRMLVALAGEWKPNSILIEDRASGQSLIQELRTETSLPVLPVSIDRDKVTRAQAVTPMMEAGKVFLPTAAPWLLDFLDELSSFPAAPHDDQVDSTTMALNWMRSPGEPVAIAFLRLVHERWHREGVYPGDDCDVDDCPLRR